MITELQTKSEELIDAPLEVRLQHFAHSFLNITYGQWKDGSDLESLDDFNYQLDVLDCVTYVELVLALAKTHPDGNFIDLLRRLHYMAGTPNYISRNHFFSLDWIPNNAPIITDITPDVAFQMQVATAVIDKINWLKVTKNITDIPMHLIHQLQPQEVRTPYISTTDLLDNQSSYFHAFPEYSICCIVRPNWDLTKQIGTHLNISHLGFVFKDHVTQTLRFYHASGSSTDKNCDLPFKVVTIDLCEYMAKYLDSPTIRGLNVLGISPGYFNAG